MFNVGAAMDWCVLVAAAGLVATFPYAGLLGLFGVLSLRKKPIKAPVTATKGQPRFVFVIPAHDEEGTIGTTLKSMQEVNYPPSDYAVVVIADNCTDQTAAVSRQFGAVVIERAHPTRRSKGFALEDSFPKLMAMEAFAKMDAFVVVDADTRVASDVLQALAPLVTSGADWIQGLDIVANPEESWRTKLLAYGFSLFNGTFQAGSEALGLGGHLRGNGMCLSRRGLSRMAWTAGGLAEDLEFSWQLRLAGEHVSFGREALFLAEMTSNPQASAAQRLRWEKGRHGLWRALRSRVLAAPVSPVRKLLWALDLTMPSLTAVVGLYSLFTVALIGITAFGGAVAAWIWVLAALLGVGFAFYGMSPFLAFGLPWSVLSALLMVPYYAIWRLIVALGRMPATWVRTARRS